MKTVIIGGVAGGTSATARLHRLDESAEIIISDSLWSKSHRYHQAGVLICAIIRQCGCSLFYTKYSKNRRHKNAAYL